MRPASDRTVTDGCASIRRVHQSSRRARGDLVGACRAALLGVVAGGLRTAGRSPGATAHLARHGRRARRGMTITSSKATGSARLPGLRRLRDVPPRGRDQRRRLWRARVNSCLAGALCKAARGDGAYRPPCSPSSRPTASRRPVSRSPSLSRRTACCSPSGSPPSTPTLRSLPDPPRWCSYASLGPGESTAHAVFGRPNPAMGPRRRRRWLRGARPEVNVAPGVDGTSPPRAAASSTVLLAMRCLRGSRVFSPSPPATSGARSRRMSRHRL